MVVGRPHVEWSRFLLPGRIQLLNGSPCEWNFLQDVSDFPDRTTLREHDTAGVSCCLVVCTVPAQRTTRRGGVFRGFSASGRFAYDLLRSATVRTPCREGFHIHVREVISAGGVDRRSVAQLH